MKIKTTGNKGIHLTKGDITFSLQFGAGNYCDNYDLDITKCFQEKVDCESTTCEVAVWVNNEGSESRWITNLAFPDNGEHEENSCDVVGHVPIEKALKTFLEFNLNGR